MREVARRAIRRGRAGLAAVALLACESDDPSSPGAAAALPEGTYAVTYTACELCPPASMPDYLLVLSTGVRGVVTISEADVSSALLELVEMRAGGTAANDILGSFADATITLEWDETTLVEPGFRGSVDYGGAAAFVAIFRRDGSSIACDFEIFHLKHDVGPTSCTVDD